MISGSKSSKTVGQRKKSPYLMSSAELHAFPPHHRVFNCHKLLHQLAVLFAVKQKNTGAAACSDTKTAFYLHFFVFFLETFLFNFWLDKVLAKKAELKLQCSGTSDRLWPLHGQWPLNRGLLPRRHLVWRDSVAVESSRAGLKSECADIFYQSFLWLLRHTDEPPKGRNSCLWLQSRSVLSSFGVVLMSCRVNFHVVRSALQFSPCWSGHIDQVYAILFLFLFLFEIN